MAFLSLVVVDGEERAGTVDAGVNGLHGHSVRAPVDDGGRPGKLSRRVTATQGKEFENEAPCRAAAYVNG
jgi:hypothetical protein